MRKNVFMLIVLTFTLSLFAEIIYVPDNYPTIQLAVNAVSPYDEIIVRDGSYTESITINTYGLTLRSENGPENCFIIAPFFGEHCIESLSIQRIEGFTFKNAINCALVLQQISELKNCIFEDNEKTGMPLIGGSAITSWKPFDELSGCIFRNNTGPHTVVISSDYPLGYDPTVNETIKNNLFIDNTNTANYPTNLKDISIMNSSSNYHGIIENNTFKGSSGGIFIDGHLCGNADLNIRNCIFDESGIADDDTFYPENVIVSYCSFTGSGYQGIYTWGEGNLTSTNPLFCEAVEYECYLLEGSPCIDAGDPTMTDLDGTRRDMGCYPSITDVKKCEGNHWNWVSFPRLDRIYNNLVLAPPVLEQFLDWPFPLELKYTGNTTVLVYFNNCWIPDDYQIKSSLGYKLNPQSAGYHYLPLEGSRLAAVYQLYYSLEPGTYHWLGYWLPESQNIVAAFGDLWQYVEKVKAEDWYFDRCTSIRGGDPQTTVSWSTEGKTLEYGKGYMVWFKDETIQNFHWTTSGESEEPVKKETSESFTYAEKPDYEVIDVVNIDPSISEIGVFEENECVGAVVVQDSSEQILVYSDNINRDPIPFDFEIVTGRGQSTSIKNYEVFNPFTGEFEPGIVISGMQEYSLVKLGEQGEPGNNTPSIAKLELYSNYPNPFNPSTTISFSVPQTSPFVTLEIFNIKGQKVKTLYSGKAEEGKHTVIWEGKDTNDKLVNSGIYFYKLETADNELTKKMLLLK